MRETHPELFTKIALEALQNLSPLQENQLGILSFQKEDPKSYVQLILYHVGNMMALSDILPILENLSFRVITECHYSLSLDSLTHSIWVHKFELSPQDLPNLLPNELKGRLEKGLLNIWHGHVENDRFNALLLLENLSSKEVVILRAYSRYLKQIDSTYSQSFIENCLLRHHKISKCLVHLFLDTFDPTGHGVSDTTFHTYLEKIESLLEQVYSLDEDKILRQFLNLILSTLRTNYFQVDILKPDQAFALKLNSRLIQIMPLPRPMYEVFIYSPRMEAIHLRGGKVSRGGIRWSERPEDFRTEILGLVKAQIVKNAVIVPTGAKGGFILKKNMKDTSAQDRLKEGIACYEIMMNTLLNLTDNLVQGQIKKPKDIRALDDDDSYLVAAADKGTANFSDIANKVSCDHGFWLKDAFASGGSLGYNHKTMGITSRGAWESVKRHFREMGVNVQEQPFSVVGVGDMAGDVFGNGMLMSRQIRLLGAFNHQHIFIDPNPDPETSYQERERLFKLPTSHWTDYDVEKLSPGGKIFNRHEKYLDLTPEIKKVFNLSKSRVSPDELIQALLKAQVDLLWLAGIGTYVKASTQSHSDVGDKSNDLVRIDGNDLRCRVVGEGANLGITQQGRIQYALAGGRLNTDAIDNSAGVNCSDHEVNIKILLNNLVADQRLKFEDRNQLLAEMTDQVAQLVLKDNYLQSQTISMIETEGISRLPAQNRLMKTLERLGRLDREVEDLPSEDAIQGRLTTHKPLTRPEISILISYGKIFAYDQLIQSDLVDSPSMVPYLIGYFPTPLQTRYEKEILDHPLRREIITTILANSIINRMGATFLTEMMEKTSTTASNIAKAYLTVVDIFGLSQYWEGIESLDNKVAASLQSKLLLEVSEFIQHMCSWILKVPHRRDHIEQHLDLYKLGVATLSQKIDFYPHGQVTSCINCHNSSGLSRELTSKICHLVSLRAAFDIIAISHKTNKPILDVAHIFFGVGERLKISSIKHQSQNILITDHWGRKAVEWLQGDLDGLHYKITLEIIESMSEEQADVILNLWEEQNREALEKFDHILGKIENISNLNISILTVIIKEISSFL